MENIIFNFVTFVKSSFDNPSYWKKNLKIKVIKPSVEAKIKTSGLPIFLINKDSFIHFSK